MALIQSDWAKLNKAYPSPQFAGHTVTMRFSIALTTAQLVTGNIIELAPLPAGCVPVGVTLDSDDLDSGTAALLDVGIMSGAFGDNDAARTCGAEFISQSNVAQAGGVVRPTLVSAYRQAAANTDRSIGVKIQTQPGTPVAGTIGLTVSLATT